jgi:hypothetical protein
MLDAVKEHGYIILYFLKNLFLNCFDVKNKKIILIYFKNHPHHNSKHYLN